MRVRTGESFRAVMRLLARPVRFAFLRLAGLISPRREIAGFEVVDLRVDDGDPWVFSTVGDVLGLIARIDPLRFARMQRDIRRIVVLRAGGAAGSYWHDWKACVLDSRHLRDDSVASTAMTLAHEATHARLRRRGFRYRGALKPRIERLCIEAEITLGGKITGAEELVAQARRDLDRVWWSDGQMVQRQDAQLRLLGWPEWTLRLREMLFKQ